MPGWTYNFNCKMLISLLATIATVQGDPQAHSGTDKMSKSSFFSQCMEDVAMRIMANFLNLRLIIVFICGYIFLCVSVTWVLEPLYFQASRDRDAFYDSDDKIMAFPLFLRGVFEVLCLTVLSALTLLLILVLIQEVLPLKPPAGIF